MPRVGRWTLHTVQCSTAQHSTVQDASRQRVNARQLWRVPRVTCSAKKVWSSIIQSGFGDSSSSVEFFNQNQLSPCPTSGYPTSRHFCEANRAFAPQVATPPNRPRRCCGRLRRAVVYASGRRVILVCQALRLTICGMRSWGGAHSAETDLFASVIL